MNSNANVQSDHRAALRNLLLRWMMILVVLPAGWILLWIVNYEVAVFVWSVMTFTYLGLLMILAFITMLAEQKYAGRLKLWRGVLAISGRIAVTGIIGILYLLVFVWIRYGPDYFQ